MPFRDFRKRLAIHIAVRSRQNVESRDVGEAVAQTVVHAALLIRFFDLHSSKIWRHIKSACYRRPISDASWRRRYNRMRQALQMIVG